MTAGPGGRPAPWTAPAAELAALAAALGPGDVAIVDGSDDPALSDADVLDRLRADIAALLDVASSEVTVADSIAAARADPGAAAIIGHPGGLAARLTGRVGAAAALDPAGPLAARRDGAADGGGAADGHGGASAQVLALASDDEATLIVDADAFGADAGALLRAFVGAPVGGWPAATLADPMAARDRAWSEGLVRPLADAVVVSDRTLVPPGGARLIRAIGPGDRFRTLNEIDVEDGGWRLRPIGPRAPHDDGLPFVAIAPSTTIAAAGGRADRTLGDALASGPGSAPVRRLIEDWWAAARALRVAGPDGRQPYDLRPRDFVIDAAGTWHHSGGRIRHRVIVPDEAVLVRGLLDLCRATLQRRWVDGADPSTTVGGLVARLAGHVGATVDTASWHLWARIETSANERAVAEPAPRDAVRDAQMASLERPVGSFWSGLPMPERVRAAVDLAGARRAGEVAAMHESLRVELLEATRARLLAGRR